MAPDSDATAVRAPPSDLKVTPILPPSIQFPPSSFSAPESSERGESPAAASSVATPPASTPAAVSLASSSVSFPAATSATAAPPQPPSFIPQKRALADEDHAPAVRSPLNPERRLTPKPQTPQDDAAAGAAAVPPTAVGREKRTKKESLKKREARASGTALTDGSRVTPEPLRRKDQWGGGDVDRSTLASAVADASAAAATGGSPDEALPIRLQTAGSLRPSDFEPPASPVFRPHHSVQVASGQEVEFFELLSDQPTNRRGYVYESGIADPRFPASNYFRHTEPKPHYAHFSFEDAPPSVYFDQSGLHINGEGGFRTTRANVFARQGRWYWECKITRGIFRTAVSAEGGEGGSSAAAAAAAAVTATSAANGGLGDAHGHVRVGWARREASRDAPVGYDAYGYGIRDRKGQKVHMSRPKDFFVDGLDVCEGDVVGLEIQLPSEALHRKVVQGTYNPAVDLADEEDGGGGGGGGGQASSRLGSPASTEGPNIVRDRVPFRFQTSKLVFEKTDYHPVKELEDLANPAPTLSSSVSNSSATATAATAGADSSTTKASGVESKAAAAAVAAARVGEPPNPNHAVPCLRTLPGSYIRVYKNGVLQGTPFSNLLAFLPPASTTNAKIQEGARESLDDGTLGYYPAVSVFRGGAAELNFGPHFWFPPPDLPGLGAARGGGTAAGRDGDEDANDDDAVMMVEFEEPESQGHGDAAVAAKSSTKAEAALPASSPSNRQRPRLPLLLTRLQPIADRYAEQIAEETVYDIVDEIYFWSLDGGLADAEQDQAASAGSGVAGGGSTVAGSTPGGDKDVVMEG